MILTATGHRPPKIGGYSSQARRKVERFAVLMLTELRPDAAISGMALGWDLAVAVACVRLEIPFTAAIPCDGQHRTWPLESQRYYSDVLANASEQIVVEPGPYAAWKMIARDKWMVDHGDELLALYNGDIDGGTAKTVRYAESKNKPVINCWERWEKFE